MSNNNTKRVHSTKIRMIFDINATGVDIIVKRKNHLTKIEVKESYGKITKFVVKPKDMEANVFLFYEPTTNLFILARRSQLPKVEDCIATSFSLARVKEASFYSTHDEEDIYNMVYSL